MVEKAVREQRLAEALRANLRRRKAQARAQDEATPLAANRRLNLAEARQRGSARTEDEG